VHRHSARWRPVVPTELGWAELGWGWGGRGARAWGSPLRTYHTYVTREEITKENLNLEDTYVLYYTAVETAADHVGTRYTLGMVMIYDIYLSLSVRVSIKEKKKKKKERKSPTHGRKALYICMYVCMVDIIYLLCIPSSGGTICVALFCLASDSALQTSAELF